MKPTGAAPSVVAYLAVAFGFGVPGGAVIIVLLWWLLTAIAHPATASGWWEHALLLIYILAPVWAPLLAGFATLRVATRLGWVDWRDL